MRKPRHKRYRWSESGSFGRSIRRQESVQTRGSSGQATGIPVPAPAWKPGPKPRSAKQWRLSCRAEPPLSSPTASPPSATRTASSLWTTATSSGRAATQSCLPRAAHMPRCTTASLSNRRGACPRKTKNPHKHVLSGACPCGFLYPLFQLNGCRRLIRDVVHDTVHAGDFVDNTVHHLLERVPGERCGLCRHEVGGLDGA